MKLLWKGTLLLCLVCESLYANPTLRERLNTANLAQIPLILNRIPLARNASEAVAISTSLLEYLDDHALRNFDEDTSTGQLEQYVEKLANTSGQTIDETAAKKLRKLFNKESQQDSTKLIGEVLGKMTNPYHQELLTMVPSHIFRRINADYSPSLRTGDSFDDRNPIEESPYTPALEGFMETLSADVAARLFEEDSDAGLMAYALGAFPEEQVKNHIDAIAEVFPKILRSQAIGQTAFGISFPREEIATALSNDQFETMGAAFSQIVADFKDKFLEDKAASRNPVVNQDLINDLILEISFFAKYSIPYRLILADLVNFGQEQELYLSTTREDDHDPLDLASFLLFEKEDAAIDALVFALAIEFVNAAEDIQRAVLKFLLAGDPEPDWTEEEKLRYIADLDESDPGPDLLLQLSEFERQELESEVQEYFHNTNARDKIVRLLVRLRELSASEAIAIARSISECDDLYNNLP